jgi:phosphoenolpyruvate synthase/pyruvate phosphate dikinase
MDLIVDIKDSSASDERITGGKGSNIAKLVNIVGEENVPYAIMVTTEFSRVLLNDEELIEIVEELDEKLSESDEKTAEKIANDLREKIENMKIPEKLSHALMEKIELMKKHVKRHRVAVRSYRRSTNCCFCWSIRNLFECST